jgi:hypothetical protein
MCIYETKSYQTRELGAVATTMLVDLGASGWADCYCSAKKSAQMGRRANQKRTKKWHAYILKRKFYVAKTLD